MMNVNFAKTALAGLFIAALGGAALNADAAQVPASKNVRSSDPAAVPSGTYVIDPDHGRILWTVSHGGYSHFPAVLPLMDGSLTVDAADLTKSKLSVTVHMDAMIT